MQSLLTIFLFATTFVHAHNNLFLPSDAYFSTAGSKEFLKALDKGEELSISYARYSTSFMACGYAGLENALIEGLPKSTRHNLQSTLLKLFKEEAGKARTRETNSGHVSYFPILIYNKDFDFSKYPVALKFNENFEKEQTQKAQRDRFVDDRISSKILRKLDKKYAKNVRALDSKSIPKDLTAFMGVHEPVVIDGSKIVFVILLDGKEPDLADHAEQKSGLEMIIVDDTVSCVTHK